MILNPNTDLSLATSRYDSKALEASAVIKIGPGFLYGISGYSNVVAGQFILLFDATAVPADGAIAALSLYIPTSGNFSADFGVYGRDFAVGLIVCNSSTVLVKAVGGNTCLFNARFK